MKVEEEAEEEALPGLDDLRSVKSQLCCLCPADWRRKLCIVKSCDIESVYPFHQHGSQLGAAIGFIRVP